MIATSADVARLAGVSRATVSQVLNGHADRFAADTAEKVFRAARELEYQPSAAGRTLRRGSSDFVLALIPHTTFGGNLQDLYERMSEELAQRGFTLVLRMATPVVDALDHVVSRMKPAAVISLIPFTAAERAMLDRRGVVGIDPPSAAQIDHNRAIGRIQGDTLIERGHTRIAFAHLQDARQDPFGSSREEGVRDAVAGAGLPSIQVIRLDIDIDSGIAALESLKPPGIAIACYNDDVATTLLSAARIRGWDVPADVALIGMDHTPLARVTIPPLTTIEYDMDAAARSATAGVLLALGADDPAFLPEPVALTVIDGGSA